MTAQELRRQILDSVKGGYQDWAEAVEDLDSLIAAAKEEERERILELVKGEYHVGPPFYLRLKNPLEPDPEWYVLLPKNVFWQDGNSGGCGTPASVLSPAPKETTLDKAGVTLRGQHGVDW